ncbi:MAG TPA: 2-oxoacid:acceptor oxidoreductase family protein, partial [Anaerolineales bacterium]|nr:2-oxoacid:acceptor oxidoreductase family protein [Anaerolineales bacterium]
EGHLARRETQEIVVAMNAATFSSDLAKVYPGGVFFFADHIKLAVDRSDVSAYPIPANRLARESGAPAKLRDYVANMAYVGVLAQMLGIDSEKIYEALDFHFKGKQSPIDLNYGVIIAAAEWAYQNLEKRDPYRLEAMDATSGYIMADGNTAAALGSIYGGVQLASWYPITPASSLAESLQEYLPQLRQDKETGKNTYAVLQAEDEIAAIGMAVGGGWAGLRSMTSTSGPGISLMTEYSGLAYFAEIPVVIWDVQRVGPSTGLPTRTQQGDIMSVRYLGHGDTEQIILLPGTVNECFEFGWRAFDLAERLQGPIFVLSDLDLGMNQWMTEPFQYPEQPMDRGKVLWEEDLDRLERPWGRYLDVDGDGIPYRTIPGNLHPSSAYFTRGTGHDEYGVYSEDPEIWHRVNARLKKKYDNFVKYLPAPVIEKMDGAQIGIISVGSADGAIQEARQRLADQKVPSDYMRIRAIPFDPSMGEFIRGYDKIFVIELNREGQLDQLLTLAFPKQAGKLIPTNFSDGLPLTARWVVDAITDNLSEGEQSEWNR